MSKPKKTPGGRLPGGKRVNEPELDGDVVLELVKKLGGYSAVAERWAKEGLVNPSTRRPYSKHSIKRFAGRSKHFAAYIDAKQATFKDFGAAVDQMLVDVKAEEKGK